MRLTLCLLGWTWDWSIEPTATDESNSLDGGTTGCYPISFVGAYDVPEECSAPQHVPAWDEPEERA